MKTLLFTIVTSITFSLFSQADCACFSVRGAQVVGVDSLEMIFHNTCSNEVYMNVYLVRNIAPFDTIARHDGFGGHFVPLNTDVAYIIHTDLTETPLFGTYTVSITNGNILCENIEQLNIAAVQDISSAVNFQLANPLGEWIELPEQVDQSAIELVNSRGQRLKMETSGNKISTSQLQQGVYFLKYRNQSYKLLKI